MMLKDLVLKSGLVTLNVPVLAVEFVADARERQG
jgi:hypothetical protein